MSKRTKQIAQAGLLIAIILMAQAIGAVALPAVTIGALQLRQLVTGTLVNLTLVIAAVRLDMTLAVLAGLCSAVLAQVMAISGRPEMLPAVLTGNAALVISVSVLLRMVKPGAVLRTVGIVAAAWLKALVMWLLVSGLIIPAMLKAAETPAPMIAALSLQFSWPQGITATAGGLLAQLILPALEKIGSYTGKKGNI